MARPCTHTRSDVRFAPKATESLRGTEMTRWADAVEKGKNELIKFFTCAPVETVIS
jgi:hypothetical protein